MERLRPDDVSDDPEPKITEKQQRVLDAALELFAEKGYAGASTSEIAKRAGVAEGTIFKTYKTKKELLIGVVAPLFARLMTPTIVDPVVDIMKHPWERVEDWLRALWRERTGMMRQHQRLLRIAMQELPFHEEVRALMQSTILEHVWPHARAQVERFQRMGQIRAGPPASIFRIIMGTFVTYAVHQVLIVGASPPKADDDAEIELMLSVIVKGLRP